MLLMDKSQLLTGELKDRLLAGPVALAGGAADEILSRTGLRYGGGALILDAVYADLKDV